MFNVVLFEPEIPPNTGNIIRLCANSGAHLHLIEPMGFRLEDAKLKRAGLDYHEFASLKIHPNYASYLAAEAPRRIFACSTKGKQNYAEVAYQAGDSFIFGPETRGLPALMLNDWQPEHLIRIPMRPESRSLNLSNAVAVIVFEAWRQLGFGL